MIGGIGTTLRTGMARLGRLSLRSKLITAGCATVVALGAFWSAVGDRGCSSREDVEARVALVSSRLQHITTQGTLSTDRLAAAVKRMNAAATTYEVDKDATAFCVALVDLTRDFGLE